MHYTHTHTHTHTQTVAVNSAAFTDKTKPAPLPFFVCLSHVTINAKQCIIEIMGTYYLVWHYWYFDTLWMVSVMKY